MLESRLYLFILALTTSIGKQVLTVGEFLVYLSVRPPPPSTASVYTFKKAFEVILRSSINSWYLDVCIVCDFKHASFEKGI